MITDFSLSLADAISVLVAISGAGTETGNGVASDESTTPRGLVSSIRRLSHASMVPPVSFAQRVDTSGPSAH